MSETPKEDKVMHDPKSEQEAKVLKASSSAETILVTNWNEMQSAQPIEEIKNDVSGKVDSIMEKAAARAETVFTKRGEKTKLETTEREQEGKSYEVGDFSIAQANQLKPGTKLGEYMIKHEIAKGGIGIAYLAENTENKEQVVVKLIRSDLELAKQIFEKEITAMKKVEHPHVEKLFREGETSEGLYLVMKYYSGGDLESRSRTLAKMKKAEILQWMKKTLPGLIESILAIHKAGIIHKDIKPQNVLLNEDGDLILADFGLATHEDEETDESTFVGTPRFSAPEQVGGKVTQMADWFSLGSTLYYLFTGRAVFDGSVDEIINGLNAYRLKQVKIPPVNKINPQIPQPLADVIMELLESNPERRLGDEDVQFAFINAIENAE